MLMVCRIGLRNCPPNLSRKSPSSCSPLAVMSSCRCSRQSKGGVPIVGGVSDSPMRAGIAVSLARPGKNFTGITFLTDEMAAKRIELLKEVAPSAKRVAVVFNPLHFDDEVTFARRGAESLGIELTTHPINSVSDLDAALHGASASGADSLLVISSRLTGIVGGKIAQHGQERRLPVIASWREFA